MTKIAKFIQVLQSQDRDLRFKAIGELRLAPYLTQEELEVLQEAARGDDFLIANEAHYVLDAHSAKLSQNDLSPAIDVQPRVKNADRKEERKSNPYPLQSILTRIEIAAKKWSQLDN